MLTHDYYLYLMKIFETISLCTNYLYTIFALNKQLGLICHYKNGIIISPELWLAIVV